MKLSDNWRLSADKYQFILERKVTRFKRDPDTKKLTDESTEEWGDARFYGSIDQVAGAIATVLAREGVEAAATLADFVEIYKYAVGIVRLELPAEVAA